MKKTILITAFALIFIFSLSGSVFAEEYSGIQKIGPASTTSSVTLEKSTNSQVLRSNGLTATASRVNSNYIRVVFTNSTSSKITDTVTIADAVITGEVLSGPFSISVPAKSGTKNGTKTYDCYVGANTSNYVITKNHGYFYFNI